jgi:23S rRNA pseudouridine2605 synthase
MTEQELQQLRLKKWRLDGSPIRTLDDAREFIDSVGFCLMYPVRPAVLVPTFIGAYVGEDSSLPTWKTAFSDPRAKDATELMVRLLREKSAYEANLFGETSFLLSASVFPFFYGLVGDRSPKQMPKPGRRNDYTPLALAVFEAIHNQGAVTKNTLREKLGGELSPAALDRALNELWSRLRITRVDYVPDEGAYWDAMYRWSPELVHDGIQMSTPEALTALLSKYIDCVVAADQTELGDFFSNFVPRSKVNEAVNALLSARELQFTTVGNRSLLHVPPPKPTPADRARRQPIVRRPGAPRPHPKRTP